MAATLLGAGDAARSVRWVLGSASPRRAEIFGLMGLQPEIVVSGFAEDLAKSSFATAAAYAEGTATEKAREVAGRLLPDAGAQPTVIVGSDTVVEIDGDVLEKPGDVEEAKAMLRRMSGRNHFVHSGVAVFSNLGGRDAGAPTMTFAETTEVTFVELTELDIENYVASREPMDKAGGYGIQGLGGQMVCGLSGCYFNVMGFPMHRFSKSMAELLLTDNA
uniref:Maf-like protein n=1 Tax=Phaeomonas parva TaxID=124430 RepID=A0A7S1TQE1_9STRA